MVKSDELQLYCFTHKVPSYGLVDDEYHTPIHVGKSLHPEQEVCAIGDNTGDNISNQNDLMRELTGMYWVWKNVKDVKYVGTEHYRRKWSLEPTEILEQLKTKSIILPEPIGFGNTSMKSHYTSCHSYVDICTIEFLLAKYAPEYVQYLNYNSFFPANCFITTKENYDKACQFVFHFLDQFISTFSLDDNQQLHNHVQMYSSQLCPPDWSANGADWKKYQSGICAFLGERLFSIYNLHNFGNSMCFDKLKKLE